MSPNQQRLHKYSGSEACAYMPNVLSPEKAIFDFTFLQILWKKYIFVFDSMTCFHFLSLRERFFADFEVLVFNARPSG